MARYECLAVSKEGNVVLLFSIAANDCCKDEKPRCHIDEKEYDRFYEPTDVVNGFYYEWKWEDSNGKWIKSGRAVALPNIINNVRELTTKEISC